MDSVNIAQNTYSAEDDALFWNFINPRLFHSVHYLPCRSDFMFKELRACNDFDVVRAFLEADLELSFGGTAYVKSLDIREATRANTSFSPFFMFECDSKFYIKAGDLEIWTDDIGDVMRIMYDMMERGVIIISEMQQQKQRASDGSDAILSRLERYLSLAEVSDYEVQADLLAAQSKTNVVPVARSTVGVAYCGYGNFGAIRNNVTILEDCEQTLESARCKSVSKICIGEPIDGSRFRYKNDDGSVIYDEDTIKGIVEEMYASLSGYSRQTREILILYAASNILTPSIVENFTNVTKKICKMLEEHNMEKVRGFCPSKEEWNGLRSDFRDYIRKQEQVCAKNEELNAENKELKEERARFVEKLEFTNNVVTNLEKRLAEVENMNKILMAERAEDKARYEKMEAKMEERNNQLMLEIRMLLSQKK